MKFSNLGLETERYMIQKMRLYTLTKASTQTDDYKLALLHEMR